MDVSRQQKCIMCTAEGRAEATSVYCGLCTIMADREVDHSPTRHAYCEDGKYQCFQCHVANCYINQMKTGGTISHCLVARIRASQQLQVHKPPPSRRDTSGREKQRIVIVEAPNLILRSIRNKL
eukprot:10034282-Ditylum_brightwellii.AAC.1